MSNRLATSTSPYLRQHEHNPVDWWPWGPEAFEEARRRDVPIFLSVGYAACHWCHVMAHESFEDETVAAAINAAFVPVKVDREERPDIDSVYMAATHALTGQGGWPMTCLLMPDGEPFWAGTYLPKLHLLRLVAAARDTWETRRADVAAGAAEITEAVRRASAPAPSLELTGADLAEAVALVAGSYDEARGGFGGAPKFPPSMVLDWLLRHHARTGSAQALRLVEGTCEAMARGGMYDQLAGGFARYSVDADWVVPHFEKMLYDNALLLGVYARWHRATGSALAARVARETADFLLRLGPDGLMTPEGAFASALDADTDGVEGLTYAWTPAQLVEVLGADEGAWAAELLHVTPAGTFEHGSSTLQLREDPLDPALWEGSKARLSAARALRPQPARDDKVVTAWNGLAIRSLADAGVILGDSSYVDAAARAADYLLTHHLFDGRLMRASRDGIVGDAQGTSADYGDLAEGLVALAQASGDARWLAAAGLLLDDALARFRVDDGGFADTPHDGEALIARPREGADNAEPAGQSALAGALLSYGSLSGQSSYVEAARAALAAMGTVAQRAPRFAGHALGVAEAFAAGPLEVAIVTTAASGLAGELQESAASDGSAELIDVVARSGSPGLVVAVGEPDRPGWPLLAERPVRDGRATAYVCRGFTCTAPTTDPDALAAQLGRP